MIIRSYNATLRPSVALMCRDSPANGAVRYRQLVEEIMGRLEPRLIDQIEHNPLYLQTLGDAPPLAITRIFHGGEEGEPASKGYDFSRATIETHQREGYRIAAQELDWSSAGA
jgi:hypothetical protein